MRTRQHSQGYILAYLPAHSRASRGWVYEHLIVAERALGRPIPLTAHVHHVNELRNDNRPINLVICESVTYHRLLHQRMRAWRACGQSTWLPCDYCGEHDNPSNLYLHRNGRSGRHLHCHTAYQKANTEHINARRRKTSALHAKQFAIAPQPNMTACACGCGGATTRIRKTDKRKNYVKGAYYVYCHGHARRK